MRELKSLLLESSYDDITSNYLWKDADPSTQRVSKRLIRKDTSDLPVGVDNDAPDDIATTVHSWHLMSAVDKDEANLQDDDDTVGNLADSFASASMENSDSKLVWQGYLEKKSPSMFTGWQKRFVVIGESGRMTYRKLEESEDISGTVPLIGTKVVWTQPKNEDDYFILDIKGVNPKERVFSFRTKAKLDMEIITTVLESTIHAQNLKKIVKLCKKADGEDSDEEVDDEYDEDGSGGSEDGDNGGEDGEEEYR